MVDKNENILVEFDYNNISVIDPNKVIDENGRAKERYVKQEELVMYANLECKVIPRTKLAVGASYTDVQTISVASMNFLKPGGKTFLDNSYTDELTGKDSLKGKGTNQVNLNKIPQESKDNDFFINQTIKSNGELGATDNGLLGITRINVRINTAFNPTIEIELEDVKGRALFESGNNSPYAAFFNLPYPLFQLTIKGYYGKAVRLPLMLQDFQTRYNASTGNFNVSLRFYTYKYNALADVSMGYLQATPHMYKSRVAIPQRSGGPANNTVVKDTIYEIGFQKIKELYSEYKSKGLISDDFPEITLVQLQQRLENFIKNVLDNFAKQNLDPLTNISVYQKQLGEFQGEVFLYRGTSWFYKYCDTKNYFVLKDGTKVYPFTATTESSDNSKQSAISELKAIITKFNEKLNSNDTVGANGQYEINGKVTKTPIKSDIEYEKIDYTKSFSSTDIDFKETYRQIKGSKQPTENDLNELINDFVKKGLLNSGEVKKIDGVNINQRFYFRFEGSTTTTNNNGSFMDLTNQMGKTVKEFRTQIENELTEALKLILESPNSGVGFVPTIRNVLAVVFANGEAFLRLLDDVHRNAWAQRDEKIRKETILANNVGNANPDNLTNSAAENRIVYPWPQFIVETTGDKGQEKYEIAYPGDSRYINQTKGFLLDTWPEIEFVEEFIRGFTERTSPPADPTAIGNEETEPKRISLDAIEFPIKNNVYSNKEQIKYFYEIWERVFLISNYSKLSRSLNSTNITDKIVDLIAESEAINVEKSLGNENPFISQKIKEYNFNGDNFLLVLRHFSNEGTGESWQNLIRGIFNTSYIKNTVENASFTYLPQSILTDSVSQPLVSLNNEQDIVNYISDSTSSNTFELTDTYPFTNYNWVNKNLSTGLSLGKAEDSFNTTKVLNFNTNKKVISNFLDNEDNTKKQLFSSFNFYSLETPSPSSYKLTQLSNFYESRSQDFIKQLPTEGNLRYSNYSGLVTDEQTVSILNTPYFINSIPVGVKKFQDNEDYPFVASAYLFINSLPLPTLREKYKNYDENNKSTTDLDYIYATFKKFGAIHKVPYAWILKIGSIYHRYKKYVDDGEDILDTSWSGFSYVNNYDPMTNSPSKVYSLSSSTIGNFDIVLQNNNNTLFNTGFYPKLINDFNLFLQGYYIFSSYTSTDIQNAFQFGLNMNYVNDAIINMPTGFDPNNLNRNLKITPWSITVDTPDKLNSFIMPSQGSFINQTLNECFEPLLPQQSTKIKYEVGNNLGMYNGSVRLFWAAPNYGYFDTTKIKKPTPFQYMKIVFSGQSNQENFSIDGSDYSYSNISEIFSVFEKDILDGFEKEFLSFSKSVYDYDIEKLPDNSLPSDASYRNFQMFFRELMKIPKPTENDGNLIVTNVQNTQTQIFQEKISKFLNYYTVFKYGNPSDFDKKLFYSFSTEQLEDPYTWNNYTTTTPSALPPQTTLANSLATHPVAWKTLQTYVGFSDINELSYKNSGSYITDFFIDNNISFESQNIINFAPIIKIYATQKLKDNTLNNTKFINLIGEYIQSNTDFQNKITTSLFIKLQKRLTTGTITPERSLNKELQGTQTQVDLWESFKAINDKWISGNDFSNKTLFEDVLFLDRASRDIGNKLLVDVFKLKNRLLNIPEKASMLSFVQSIIIENNFVVMNIPAYVNFYNVQDAVKNPIPKPDGTLEFANTLFGTFLNVDYRNSSTKLVCLYAGKPSEHLDVKSIDYRYKNDAFDLRRASDNPLIEDLTNKKDWGLSNKVVGFNVDIGPQNQSIFHGFFVDQRGGTPTAEGMEILNQMANQGGNRGGATQSTSLYNLYKNRSYNCTVTMMGNALIQPTMYFNLRHVPMFSGPYLILSVNHNISPGMFETQFTGVRQPIYSLSKIDSYLQSLKTNLLQSLVERDKQAKKQTQTTPPTDIIGQNTSAVSSIVNPNSNSVNTTQTCTADTSYSKYTVISTPTKTTINFNEVVNKIKSLTNDNKLRHAVFARLYVNSRTSAGLINKENNFAGIPLNQNWGDSIKQYTTSKQFWCSSVNIPYAIFDSVDGNLQFLVNRWRGRLSKYEVTSKDLTKFLVLNQNSTPTEENVYSSLNSTDLTNMEAIVEESIKIFNSIP